MTYYALFFLSRAFLIYIYYKLVVTIGNKVEKLRFSYTGQEIKERKKIYKRRRGKKNLTNIVGRFFLNRQILSKKNKKKIFLSHFCRFGIFYPTIRVRGEITAR